MKKRLFSCFIVIVLIMSSIAETFAAETDFIDNPNWIETTSTVVNEQYSNDKPFIVMYYRTTCFNSNLRKTILSDIMSEYDVEIYGVDIDKSGNSIGWWAWDKMGYGSVTLPVICVVKNSSEYEAFPASTNMRTIEKSICELIGVIPGNIIDFYTINDDIYESYQKNNNPSAFLKDESKVNSVIATQTGYIIDGLSSDYEKLKAIHDWIADNIYYDYVLLNTGVGVTSAIDTYRKKKSVCQGYANLMAEMCHAARIPCRVVKGFATGAGSDAYASAVWKICQTYKGDIDIMRISEELKSYKNHAWNEAYVDGRWVIVDTTWDSNNEAYATGLIKAKRSDEFFDLSLEDFSSTHLMLNEYYISDKYQAGIMELETKETGYIVHSRVQNNSAENKNCTVFTAVYNKNGNLKACNIDKVLVYAEKYADIKADIICSKENGDEVKVFVWEEFEPLTDYKYKSIK